MQKVHHENHPHHTHHRHSLGKRILYSFFIFVFFFFGFLALWISTFKVPDLTSFDTRKITQSTKIYDRTGKVLLYDVHENKQSTMVAFENISKDIKNATVAIEDESFYEHHGIKISSIFRSFFANILSGSFSQGGSTITQQVVKNSLLTTEKTISRKIKEIVLSLELERTLTKEQILAAYLNENPYGGNIYGVEQASETFFGKDASDVDLAESAYIAAIPKAPTYYSPYGQNKAALDARQKLVLSKMLSNKFITQDEYKTALAEKVEFQPKDKLGIKAPHFVEFIKQYIADKYGDEALNTGGLKVITTLDYDMQAKTEEIVKKWALSNEQKFNGKNAASVIMDPKTGQILTMVGSRDYFDTAVDGNFNVAIAHRQPGSTFKPFVYATAFEKGYTPDTVLFDVPTEFQASCSPDGTDANNPLVSQAKGCYYPVNYDGKFLGPISLRNALAQSRNIPSIKLLYLAGIKDSLQTARDMGIKSLSDDPNQYGLTLVLGGGEVSLLDMTSAYGVFANDGVRTPYTGILSIEDSKGNVLEQFTAKPDQAIPSDIAERINDVLSDTIAKIPAYGENSPLYFPGRQVADKTGTTNDYKDAWSLGYTPEIVVGAWTGNNDNTPMEKKTAGLIVAPMWSEIMHVALASTEGENFVTPPPIDPNTKPILLGDWKGNPSTTYQNNTLPGYYGYNYVTPVTNYNIHSILYYIDRKNPTGPAPLNPSDDPQYNSWEYGVQKWVAENPTY